jgi:hypothetical protein
LEAIASENAFTSIVVSSTPASTQCAIVVSSDVSPDYFRHHAGRVRFGGIVPACAASRGTRHQTGGVVTFTAGWHRISRTMRSCITQVGSRRTRGIAALLSKIIALYEWTVFNAAGRV